FLLLPAGLMFETLALLYRIVLFGVSRSDLLAVDAAFEDLHRTRVLGRKLSQRDKFLRRMRDEGGVDERRLDQLFENGLSNFEIDIFFPDLRTQLHGEFAAAGGREVEPIGTGAFAHDVLIFDTTPRRSEVDRFGHVTFRVLMFDHKSPQDFLRN